MNQLLFITSIFLFIIKILSECPQSTYFDPSTSRCIPCQDGCSNCYNFQICLECGQGYYLTPNLKCNKCNDINCLKCDSFTGACLQCRAGLSSINGICTQNCPSNCQACTTNGICQQCKDEYYLTPVNNYCLACPVNCISCPNGICNQCESGYLLNNNVCTSPYSICPIGYFYNQQRACERCPYINKCSQCLNGFSCIACESGYNPDSNGICKALQCPKRYYMNSQNMCLACPNLPDCVQCMNNQQCLTCKYGFSLDYEGKCVTQFGCAPNCAICSAEGCKQCKLGFILSNGICTIMTCQSGTYYDPNLNQCIICPNLSNCQQCLNANQCAQCKPGFLLSSNGVCVLPACPSKTYFDPIKGICTSCPNIPNCKQCLDSQKCAECQQGFQLNNQGTCSTPCPINCNLCSGSVCLQCNTGFLLINGGCSLPYKCIGGYYYNEQLQCAQCPSMPHCVQCINNERCVKCETNYYPDYKGSCIPYVCPQGYYINSKRNCLKCPHLSNCTQCLNDNQCAQCLTNFLPNSNGQCIATSTICKENCDACDNGFCRKCIPGYFLDLKGDCESCPDILGCSQCADNQKCLVCQSDFILNNQGQCSRKLCASGFYLNSQNICAPCSIILNCLACSNDQQCSICKQGYTLTTQGTCVTIQQCPSGFFFGNTGSCIKCPELPNCMQCINQDRCAVCTNGYISNTNGFCVPIGSCLIADCLICRPDLQGCIQCNPGFSLTNRFMCQECPQNCKSCDSRGICTECQAGFYKAEQRLCLPCKRPCMTCVDTNSTCTSCLPGTILAGIDCIGVIEEPNLTPLEKISAILANPVVWGWPYQAVL